MLVIGDLFTYLNEVKYKATAHGCNCFCTFGKGLAATIKEKYPEVYLADQNTRKGDKSKLGKFTFAKVNGVLIYNLYTQFTYGQTRRHVRYSAVRSSLEKMQDHLYSIYGDRMDEETLLVIPLIGGGLAGGEVDKLMEIYHNTLVCKWDLIIPSSTSIRKQYALRMLHDECANNRY
jgi:O-acetyl-ADP-ribose deacetylase (regulator of RNase III)